MGIIGPNGAGKSTLLKSILDLTEKASGYVRIFNQELNEVRQRVSYVPQRESVDWDLPTTVYDVVLMGRYGKLGLFKRPTQADKEVATSCLEDVGMLAYKDRQISQLSGGQQQRVFLARAFAQQGDIYFMDEPFAAVDAATEQAIVTLLKELNRAGKTCLVVHHDLSVAHEAFDCTVLLNNRVVAAGPTTEVMTDERLRLTYGGRLPVMEEAAERVARAARGLREPRT